MSKKRKKLRGTVEKVINSAHPSQVEKAQIDLHDADFSLEGEAAGRGGRALSAQKAC